MVSWLNISVESVKMSYPLLKYQVQYPLPAPNYSFLLMKKQDARRNYFNNCVLSPILGTKFIYKRTWILEA